MIERSIGATYKVVVIRLGSYRVIEGQGSWGILYGTTGMVTSLLLLLSHQLTYFYTSKGIPKMSNLHTYGSLAVQLKISFWYLYSSHELSMAAINFF